MKGSLLYFNLRYSRRLSYKIIRHITPPFMRYPKFVGLQKVPSQKAGSAIIKKLICQGEPFMLSRLGGVEANVILERIRILHGEIATYDENLRRMSNLNAGIFPNDDDTLDRFVELYYQSAHQADVMGVWGVGAEEFVIKSATKHIRAIPFHSIYPAINDWSKALQGKRVLVVHPFAKSIESQYYGANRAGIFANETLLPDFELRTFVPVVSFAGETPAGFQNWFDALAWMKKEITNRANSFDICLIGCGAYGLPLAAHVRSLGKAAVHVGGSLQLLFGISSKYYENLPLIKPMVNRNWVYPSEDETPKGAKLVENGCYWG